MRPIVNVPEEDQVTDIGNMHKKFGKDRACGSADILADRQTDTDRHILITVLRNRSRGRSKNERLETALNLMLVAGYHDESMHGQTEESLDSDRTRKYGEHLA